MAQDKKKTMSFVVLGNRLAFFPEPRDSIAQRATF